MKDKPNIIIFNPDQWRGDMLGYLGYPGAQTPNLDNIIKESDLKINEIDFLSNVVWKDQKLNKYIV